MHSKADRTQYGTVRYDVVSGKGEGGGSKQATKCKATKQKQEEEGDNCKGTRNASAEE
eukprot:CAMPEP_0174303458 /NCGR_PEP_ID=MMETSP0809-20121228/60199_1 /TAXON_ID=73025 ORGANISM="Eutreptiella gymnastica-like, Strain CCMP1594" /NCGR_SAMPLE_ID=MMETSP0809 /ASSEMBLY_ACC=CAM_ASM_000658 /LENGTH=57 /DNA_ID=CAMNT_0015409487 /DNA_START=1139 /DNA_END=1312 /DNA_ORIENTATION=+